MQSLQAFMNRYNTWSLHAIMDLALKYMYLEAIDKEKTLIIYYEHFMWGINFYINEK